MLKCFQIFFVQNLKSVLERSEFLRGGAPFLENSLEVVKLHLLHFLQLLLPVNDVQFPLEFDRLKNASFVVANCLLQIIPLVLLFFPVFIECKIGLFYNSLGAETLGLILNLFVKNRSHPLVQDLPS